uniref:Peptidase S1 domain-containing protein n=1 Tax=Anopheles quadriannulatus TaxID=34691 RepID=A0A182XPY7_ANOQN
MMQVISLVLLGLMCCNEIAAKAGAQCGAQSHGNVKIGDKGVVQSGRIVNGIKVNPERYPFIVNIYYNGQFYISGNIITPSHFSIYGGGTTPLSGGIAIPVTKITIHPKIVYNFGTLDFNLVVISVPVNSFQGKTNMAPIPLQTSEVLPGSRCYVIGWGLSLNNYGNYMWNGLHYATMNIVSQSTCSRSWAFYHEDLITSNMICAKYCFGVDICYGDLGGPL